MQVDNPRGTSILSFTITADSPENAQRIAGDVVESLKNAIADVSNVQDSTLVKILEKKNEAAKQKWMQIWRFLKIQTRKRRILSNRTRKILLERTSGYEKAKAEETVKSTQITLY